MHNNALNLFIDYALPLIQEQKSEPFRNLNALEVGPDSEFTARAVLPRYVNYYHCDAKNILREVPSFVLMQGEYTIKMLGSYFDIVYNLNVMEHVRRPWSLIGELSRVLKPGGLLICVSPVSWPYHECPIDCWRLYPQAYYGLFEYGGIQPVLVTTGTGTIEGQHLAEHGDRPVVDTIAIGRKI